MSEPALPWIDPSWLALAGAWIDAELERLGRPRTGAIEQPHARPWATALRVPTGDGPVWFKANLPELSHEATVVAVLAGVRPELVPVLLAADPETGWMLFEDAGERLRELPGPGRWDEVLPLYAGLQQAAVPAADALVAAGAPDRRLEVLPGFYDELVGGAIEGLDDGQLSRLRALTPQVAEVCDELAGHGIAETIQHDDLHDGQIFLQDGRFRFIDWGDASVSHPFMTLTVTLNSIAYARDVGRDDPEAVRARDAYLDAWPGTAAGKLRQFELADRLGHVSRALSWSHVVAAMPAPFDREYVDSISGWLEAFLDT